MNASLPPTELADKVETIRRLAEELYRDTQDFPAINRNAKRVLASATMMRINLEEPLDD